MPRSQSHAACAALAARSVRARSAADPGHAEVFKLYSQATLGMMREAIAKLDREANEHSSNFRTVQVTGFIHIFRTVGRPLDRRNFLETFKNF